MVVAGTAAATAQSLLALMTTGELAAVSGVPVGIGSLGTTMPSPSGEGLVVGSSGNPALVPHLGDYLPFVAREFILPPRAMGEGLLEVVDPTQRVQSAIRGVEASLQQFSALERQVAIVGGGLSAATSQFGSAVRAERDSFHSLLARRDGLVAEMVAYARTEDKDPHVLKARVDAVHEIHWQELHPQLESLWRSVRGDHARMMASSVEGDFLDAMREREALLVEVVEAMPVEYTRGLPLDFHQERMEAFGEARREALERYDSLSQVQDGLSAASEQVRLDQKNLDELSIPANLVLSHMKRDDEGQLIFVGTSEGVERSVAAQQARVTELETQKIPELSAKIETLAGLIQALDASPGMIPDSVIAYFESRQKSPGKPRALTREGVEPQLRFQLESARNYLASAQAQLPAEREKLQILGAISDAMQGKRDAEEVFSEVSAHVDRFQIAQARFYQGVDAQVSPLLAQARDLGLDLRWSLSPLVRDTLRQILINRIDGGRRLSSADKRARTGLVDRIFGLLDEAVATNAAATIMSQWGDLSPSLGAHVTPRTLGIIFSLLREAYEFDRANPFPSTETAISGLDRLSRKLDGMPFDMKLEDDRRERGDFRGLLFSMSSTYIRSSVEAFQAQLRSAINAAAKETETMMRRGGELVTWLVSHVNETRSRLSTEEQRLEFYRHLLVFAEMLESAVARDKADFAEFESRGRTLPERVRAYHDRRVFQVDRMFAVDVDHPLIGYYGQEWQWARERLQRLPTRIPLFIRDAAVDGAYRATGEMPRFFDLRLGTAVMFSDPQEMLSTDERVVLIFHGATTEYSTISSSGHTMLRLEGESQVSADQPRRIMTVAVANPTHEFGPYDPRMDDPEEKMDWVGALRNYYEQEHYRVTGLTNLLILHGRSYGGDLVAEHAVRRGTAHVAPMGWYSPTPFWLYYDLMALARLGRSFNWPALERLVRLDSGGWWTFQGYDHERHGPLPVSVLIMVGGRDRSYPTELPEEYPPDLLRVRPELQGRNPRQDELTMVDFARDRERRFGASARLYLDPEGEHNLFSPLKQDGSEADSRMAQMAAQAFIQWALAQPD